MALVSVTNLNKRAGGKWVLWDVSLEVGAGEILGIFGRSDSGKTTLARILAGLDEPSSGSVALGDGDEAPPFHVSLAASSPASAPELTVYENLNMFASLWGVPRRRRVKEITFLLGLLGLSDQRSTRAARLSSGAARRMEIARALAADSPLTLIDSLLDTLDPETREKLWDYLLALRRDEGKSFIVMTSVSRVAELCGRMAVIHRGRIGFVGSPDDFRRLAGEDLVVLGDVSNPALRNRIQERLSVLIEEQEGFLSFKVANGERMVSDLLAEFGSDVGCVYLKRPTLDDALNVLASSGSTVAAGASQRGR